jgi:cytochrome c oxidase cbb3-type subunit 4
MDINDLRSIVTVVGLLCFLAIVAWAYGRGSKRLPSAIRPKWMF